MEGVLFVEITLEQNELSLARKPEIEEVLPTQRNKKKALIMTGS